MNESGNVGLGESVPQRVDLSDLAFLLENLSALGAYLDPGQRHCYVNRAYETFFGLSRKEILGRTIREIAGPEHQAIASPHIVQVLKAEPQIFLSSIRHIDGGLRDIEVSYSLKETRTGR